LPDVAVRPRRWRQWWGWWGTADGRAVLVLLAVPMVVFILPALAGHPAIGGDNVIQNLPLRVLSGRLLRQGHLPLWNPYIWSGTPLLGGLNAGAAYPLTLVFAVLPPTAAWIVNLLGVYWAAGLGLYVLLRQFRVRPLAGVLAALTYAFTGALSGQMVHLGVVQGMGWIPWMVLAQIRLSWAVLGTGPAAGPTAVARPSAERGPAPGYGRRSPWPWVVLLAAALGLIVLTGEPRSMAEAEVVAAVVTLWLVLRPYGPGPVGMARRARFIGLSVLAAVWGVALAAVQVVPGWSFINASQRASESYTYFGAGSLRPAWTALLLVPDLFGGDGLWHQPAYFNSYNLPEVTGYVGLLPLVAALALATRCVGRRRDPRSADWGLWLLLGVLGLVLAWGSYIPLGHLFVHIPLFGKTRLQSRNLGICDLALAVLLGFWADRALGRHPEEAGLDGGRRWLVTAPAAAAGLLCLAAIAIPGPLEQYFGTSASGGVLARSLTPWFLVQLGVAVVVTGLVLGWCRLSRSARRRCLTVVVVADIGLFMLSSSVGLTDGETVLEPTTAEAAAVLGNSGRFAIYDTAGPTETLNSIGQPDLNIFTKLPSVMGYGSILSDAYGQATGAHTLDTLSPCALADGAFVPLRLTTLLTLPAFVAPPAPASGPPIPPAACPGAPVPGTATRRTFYFGQQLPVASVALVRTGAPTASTRPLRLGVLGPGGGTTWPRESVRRTASGWSVAFAAPPTAAGLVVAGPARSVGDTSVVTATGGQRWALDGVLQDALANPSWRYAGTWKRFARFATTSVLPPVWIAAPASGARVRQISSTDDGRAVARVTATRAVTVVRSEAYMAGWHVVARPAGGGPARTLPVVPDGVVQSVRVPPGRWTLTFGYWPEGLDVGLAGSALGLAALVVAGAWGYGRRRRRLSTRAPSTPSTAAR
jgi:hypothetical protein